jgi:hypothetical protein
MGFLDRINAATARPIPKRPNDNYTPITGGIGVRRFRRTERRFRTIRVGYVPIKVWSADPLRLSATATNNGPGIVTLTGDYPNDVDRRGLRLDTTDPPYNFGHSLSSDLWAVADSSSTLLAVPTARLMWGAGGPLLWTDADTSAELTIVEETEIWTTV